MKEGNLPDGHLQDCASVLSVVVAEQGHVREEQLLHLDDQDDQDNDDGDVVVVVVVTHQGHVREEQLFHMVRIMMPFKTLNISKNKILKKLVQKLAKKITC